MFKRGNCCTSRHPPSPDGFPPRPTVSEAAIVPQVPRDPVISWTAAEHAELRAIFEEDDKDVEAEIMQVKDNSTRRLKAILLGDETHSGSHSAKLNIRKSNTNTLIAVTQKLKKHLSLESAGPSKRHSRSSVGTSEEEIERRAELRRIRTKRIKEELSNEGLYDDDAKSMASFSGINTRVTSGLRTRASWAPGDIISYPSLDPPSLDLPHLNYPALPLPVLTALAE